MRVTISLKALAAPTARPRAAPNQQSNSQPASTLSRSSGDAMASTPTKTTDSTANDAVAPAISSRMRAAKTSSTRTLRWYSRFRFWWMALTQWVTVLRHTSTDE